MITTVKLLAMNLPLQLESQEVYLQVPTIRIVIPELWCCPIYQAQETTSNFCQALCLCKYLFPHPLFSHIFIQTFLNSDLPGCAYHFRDCFSSLNNQFSEVRHPLKPSCLFTVLYLQHPWPLVFFLHVIL